MNFKLTCFVLHALCFVSLPAMARTSLLTTDQFISSAATEAQWYSIASQQEMQHFGNTDILKLAQRILDENNRMSNELASVVASPSVGVDTMGNYVDSNKLNGMLDKLSDIPPQEFEHRYIEMIDAALEQDSAIFSAYAQRGDNPALRSFAARNALLLAKDYQEAHAFKSGHAGP